jgi:hypothetical protein
MWCNGARYRHRNCLDIDIEVVKVMYRDSNRIKLKVIYVRQSDGASYGFPPERVEIKRKDYCNWSPVVYGLIEGKLVGKTW